VQTEATCACLPSVPLIRRRAVDHCLVRSALCRVRWAPAPPPRPSCAAESCAPSTRPPTRTC